ncbi:glycoside hydrolase superfamily [Mucidula mucida]|nr:glycoside hydrolase superfamily [Mucidula mucida]
MKFLLQIFSLALSILRGSAEGNGTGINPPCCSRLKGISGMSGLTCATVGDSVAPASNGFSHLNAKLIAKGKKFWGSCADCNTLSLPANAALLRSEFGQVTPEDSMKWDFTEPTEGSFIFAGADLLVNWAIANHKQIRGHNLESDSLAQSIALLGNGSFGPGYHDFCDPKPYLSCGWPLRWKTLRLVVLVDGVCNLVLTFGLAWDVVNECLNDDGTLRSSVFSNLLGEDFITIAFKAARAADSTAKLYINDYNMDSNNAKVQGMIALVKRINSAETVIDAIGTQMHLDAGGASDAQAALTALASSGVSEVAITELDIAGASPADYTAVVEACLAVPQCAAITSWGVSDINSWRTGVTPDLFDSDYQPKPAYEAVIAALT